MSTRAVYTFADEVRLHPSNDTGHHVYKHHDGYPSGGLEWIANARASAWPLPRFEADEFAAAFVAANKTESGDVRLSSGIGPRQIASDAEYWYVVTALDGEIHVTIHECDWWGKATQQRGVGAAEFLDEGDGTWRAVGPDNENWGVYESKADAIAAVTARHPDFPDAPSEKEIFSGTLDAAIAKYGLVSRMVAATA